MLDRAVSHEENKRAILLNRKSAKVQVASEYLRVASGRRIVLVQGATVDIYPVRTILPVVPLRSFADQAA